MKVAENYYNISKTADYLGISDTTVRNWIKHKFLNPNKFNGKIYFKINEIKKLKEDIDKGKINRLSSRANKVKSTKNFIPEEYLTDLNNSTKIKTVVKFILNNKLDISNSLFILSLSFAFNEKLIKNIPDYHSFSVKNINFINQQLKEEISEWFLTIDINNNNDLFTQLSKFILPTEPDILGIIYQSIMLEGEKAKKGSYYTPKFIVKDIISDHLLENSKVLDPCCGTGQFLMEVSKKIKDPNLIFGIDIDKIAVRIARINLINVYKHLDFKPNIFNNNILHDFNKHDLFPESNFGNFNLIMTNPPWGLHFKNSELKILKKLYPEINSLESFSYILNRCIDLLKDKGKISFILPESILNIKIHSDIRKIILTKTNLLKIRYLDKVFNNVFTPVIRLDLNSISKTSSTNMIEIANKNKIYKIEQSRYLDNQNYIFNIHANEIDHQIIKKVMKVDHITLKNNADWALGIVTGNNAKFISKIKKNGTEPIFTGKDVTRYLLKDPTNFIKFVPSNFQQVAPENKYRTEEKLIYKFISKNLVFSYDNKQLVTLNSANILIPKIDNYPIKIILALFNSTLYQFLYQKLFSSIKILKGQLETLPLPKFSNKEITEILNLVNNILEKKTDLEKIDNYIFNYFKITDETKIYILKAVK